MTNNSEGMVIDWQNLHQKFIEYGQNAKEWMRKCILLLPEIEKYEIWKKKGFSCIYEYAAKLAGMTKDQVDDALYTLRKIIDKPALLQVVEKKGLNSVRPIVAIATQEDQDFWAEKAMEMSNNTLRTYVRDVRDISKTQSTTNVNMTQSSSDEKLNKRSDADSKTLTINLNHGIIIKLEKFNKGDWNELMQKFIDLYEKNLEQELKQEKPAPAVGTSHHIPKKINDYVLKRSHGKCEFPNCNKKYEHLHHTNRYSSNKIHDPDQIVALCEAHHDVAHKGLIENENDVTTNNPVNPTSTWRIQKEPDYANLNQFVDQQVQFYRRNNLK